MNQLIPIVCNLVIRDNNLWTPSKITHGFRDTNCRQNLSRKMNLSSAKYMVTGMVAGGDKIVCGHLVPCTSELSKVRELGFGSEHLNDCRNLVFWATGIEYCYEHLKISFIKQSPLRDTLSLKIWDESIKKMPIYRGSDRTIADYENSPLNLDGHVIFKKALSFQAYEAYLNSQSTDKLLQDQCLFGSPGNYNFKSTMDLLRIAHEKIKDEEIEEEVKEEEEKSQFGSQDAKILHFLTTAKLSKVVADSISSWFEENVQYQAFELKFNKGIYISEQMKRTELQPLTLSSTRVFYNCRKSKLHFKLC